MSQELVHKRVVMHKSKLVCGKPNYEHIEDTLYWKHVTCSECLKLLPKTPTTKTNQGEE
jgi:hypothetical protein